MDRPFGGFRRQKRGVSVLGLRFGSCSCARRFFHGNKDFFRNQKSDRAMAGLD